MYRCLLYYTRKLNHVLRMRAIKKGKAVHRPWRDKPWERQGQSADTFLEVHSIALEQEKRRKHIGTWKLRW